MKTYLRSELYKKVSPSTFIYLASEADAELAKKDAEIAEYEDMYKLMWVRLDTEAQMYLRSVYPVFIQKVEEVLINKVMG